MRTGHNTSLFVIGLNLCHLVWLYYRVFVKPRNRKGIRYMFYNQNQRLRPQRPLGALEKGRVEFDNQINYILWGGNFLLGAISLGRVVVPSPKQLYTFLGPMRSCSVMEGPIGSAVREILQYTQPDKQTFCYFIIRIGDMRHNGQALLCLFLIGKLFIKIFLLDKQTRTLYLKHTKNTLKRKRCNCSLTPDDVIHFF